LISRHFRFFELAGSPSLSLVNSIPKMLVRWHIFLNTEQPLTKLFGAPFAEIFNQRIPLPVITTRLE
jgi:hypothetical protein